MIVFPNCKINLGLSIINKRSDGFHNLETVFYPVPVTDALEIIQGHFAGSVKFSTSGIPVTGESRDNLCMKAYDLLHQDYPGLPPVTMHLHKAIPMSAGLGGGSADGAFVLLLLNTLFNLRLSVPELIQYAAKLGSDCPFFIINTPCFATGRGEILEPLVLDLSGYSLILVNGGIAINTGWAFSQLKPPAVSSRLAPDLKAIISQPVSSWKGSLMNDFELPVFEKHPEVKSIRDHLYEQGALFASMSGSGSTVFGIFEKNNFPPLHFPASYTIFKV